VLVLFIQRPNEGTWWIYVIRILALLGIIAAIVRKNYRRRE